jgi:asparaginyl-tRNA synthetase
MLEVEAAFITSVHQVMDIAEEGVRGVLGGLKKRMVEADAEDAGRKDSGGIGAFWRKAEVRERVEGAIGAEGWMRMSYSEAVELLQKVQKEAEERSSGNLTAETVTASSSTSSPDPSSLPPISAPFEYPPIHGQSLKSEHEKYLAGSYAKRPIFVYDYPADLKPFYMLPTLSSSKTSPSSTSSPPEPTVACFDLLVPELGELAGGSLREHRLEPLLESIKYIPLPSYFREINCKVASLTDVLCVPPPSPPMPFPPGVAR